MPLLDVENLSVRFETRQGTVRAVDEVSFSLEPGETLGLVGESGSGKSVSNLAILGLIPNPPGVVDATRIEFDGRDLRDLSEKQLRAIRGAEISIDLPGSDDSSESAADHRASAGRDLRGSRSGTRT